MPKILSQLSQMDAKKLAQLEANAKRVLTNGSSEKRREATEVLEAIDVERIRRTEEERSRRSEAKAAIEHLVKDKSLFDRVVLAFDKMPPADWETEALRALAANPGGSGTIIAKAMGRSNYGYTNLAIGSLCSAREPYLITPEWRAKPPADRYFSEFIVDFSRSDDSEGVTVLTLKPEAEAALRHLGII